MCIILTLACKLVTASALGVLGPFGLTMEAAEWLHWGMQPYQCIYALLDGQAASLCISLTLSAGLWLLCGFALYVCGQKVAVSNPSTGTVISLLGT